jgi:hypothetical protein
MLNVMTSLGFRLSPNNGTLLRAQVLKVSDMVIGVLMTQPREGIFLN